MKKVFFLVSFFLVALLSCNDGSNYSMSKSTEASPEYDMEEMRVESVEDVGSNQPAEAIQPQKIIKTGYFTFETKSVDATFLRVKNWTNAHQGFIQNDKTSKEYDRIHRSLLIRIPTNSFQTLVDSIHQSVKTLDRKDIILEDVTEEFVDIEARLVAKRKLEERYLQLLSKATSVKDMLEIERQIAIIREEIESKQGRLKYLQNKVSMSSIHIDFYEMTTTEKAPSQTYSNRLWRAVKGGFEGIGDFIIGMLYIWPFIIIAILIGFYLKRKIKTRKSK